MMASYIGKPVKRVEDPRLITGAAKYLDDLQIPGMLHAVVLRSAYAHARIRHIDTSVAAAVPGVVAVLTGKDFEELPPLPCAWQASAGRIPNYVNTPRVLEIDRVTFTGAGIAVVVAEDRYIAQDALNLIRVEYEPVPVVVDAEKAAQPGAPQLHENAAGNICMDWECGDSAATAAALEEADVVVRQRLINQRLIPSPLDTRGAVAQLFNETG
jgi:carbon-monoxide dehydrogenase large subunit